MKRKPFLFEGTTQKSDAVKNKIKIEFQSHFIVCGTLAIPFLKSLKIPDLNIDTDAKYFAFNLTKSGDMDIEGRAEVSSDITYKETRHKKKASEIDYEHKDKVTQSIISASGELTHYKQCEPDFKAEKPIYFIVIGRDPNETEALLNDFEKKCNRQTNYFVRCFPNHSVSIPFNAGSFHSIACEEKDTDSEVIGYLAKSFKNMIEENYKKYLEQLKQEVTDGLITKIKADIESELHQKSDAHFKKKR